MCIPRDPETGWDKEVRNITPPLRLQKIPLGRVYQRLVLPFSVKILDDLLADPVSVIWHSVVRVLRSLACRARRISIIIFAPPY